MNDPEQGFLCDRSLLEWLQQHGPAAPRDICESRRRENVIRIRCRELCECGFLEHVTHDVFSITPRGVQILSGELGDLPPDGNLSISEHRDALRWMEEENRITDFSGIDAETIKQFNYERYRDPEDTYGLVEGSREKTERRIWNVQDLSLERVMREFPRREPVVQQCAHWVRAMSGKHFFPDANHRTAIGSLRAILELNNISIPERWPGNQLDRIILKAKFVRTFVVDVRFDTLWSKDELYHVWHRHFRNVFYEIEDINHHDISTPQLGRALDAARNELGI